MKPVPKVLLTSTQELPDQQVMEFFEQGIPITQTPRDVVIKKSNAAIKVVSTLGLLELKIIDACFFIAKDRISENITHSADLEYFKWLLSFNSQNREHLKRSLTKIQQTLIQINIIDEANPNKDFWHSTVFVYDVSITGGKIYFRIPESIRQPLVNPKSWTFLSFRIKNKFTSEYPYRLYERCRADQFKGATDWYEIAAFKAMMNTENMYTQFQDLNKRVITPAVEQINLHSDIFITPDYKLRGRAKTHIRFIIEENLNVAKFEDEKAKMPIEVFESLKTEFGFSNTQINELAEYPLEKLIQKIEFARYRIKHAKKPINRKDRYLLNALKEDLYFNNSEISLFENEKKRANEEDRLKKEILNPPSAKNKKQVPEPPTPFDVFKNLSDELKKDIFEKYQQSVEFTSGDGNLNLENPMVRISLTRFLRRTEILNEY